jgi:serine/threonine protein phosphatase PrpC
MGYAPGYKSTNQDACTAVHPYLDEAQALMAVADGHGVEGHCVSSFIQRKCVMLGWFGRLGLPVMNAAHQFSAKQTIINLLCASM